MNFTPQDYNIEDIPMESFIDSKELSNILASERGDKHSVRAIIDKSLSLSRLSLAETATLINAADPEDIAAIMDAARTLKRRVYGNRIVLFAPLYIGNRCINNCAYCGFRASNGSALRMTLSDSELTEEVRALERGGHKRLILVYGEHPLYDAQFIARNVRQVYGIREGHGEIRRVNINAAPMEIEGFRTIKEAGIGTYQIFQETYDPERYRIFHPSGRKADYDYRLTALDRAMEAGIDDVGLGVLLGLGDWRYELLALIRHTNHLEKCYGVGPHTISFPRIKNASELNRTMITPVGDDDFKRFVAILRLAVPYTGLILTAREEPALRDELIAFGVSQIDAGTNLEIGGYSESELAQAQSCVTQITSQDSRSAASGSSSDTSHGNTPEASRHDQIPAALCGHAAKTPPHPASGQRPDSIATRSQNLNREQFELGDQRSLADMIYKLSGEGYIPSFCTACYRKGRTGEHFMEFSTKGFIKRFCTPNALLTFAEYLEDYAPGELRREGWELIERELVKLETNSDTADKPHSAGNTIGNSPSVPCQRSCPEQGQSNGKGSHCQTPAKHSDTGDYRAAHDTCTTGSNTYGNDTASNDIRKTSPDSPSSLRARLGRIRRGERDILY